jgi:hypothetical protein
MTHSGRPPTSGQRMRVTAGGGTNESGMIWSTCVDEVTSKPAMELNGSTGYVGIGRLMATLEGIGGQTLVGIGLEPEAGVTGAPRFATAIGNPPSLSGS